MPRTWPSTFLRAPPGPGGSGRLSRGFSPSPPPRRPASGPRPPSPDAPSLAACQPMARSRPFRNRLNDLDPKDWIKFQKSWFVHNPPIRRKDVLRHPAKFPESLAQEFVEFFTKRGQIVLDPMVGTGSTLVACLRAGRPRG